MSTTNTEYPNHMTASPINAAPGETQRMQHLLEFHKLLKDDYTDVIGTIASRLVEHTADWCFIGQVRGMALHFDAIAHSDAAKRQQVSEYLDTNPLAAEGLQNWDDPQLKTLTGMQNPLTLPIMGRTGSPLGYISVGLIDPNLELDDMAHMLVENTAHMLGNALERDSLMSRVYSLDNTVHAERGRLYSIMQLMPVGIAIIDAPTQRVIMSNREMDRLRGDLNPENIGILEIQLPEGSPLPPEEEPIKRALAGETVRNLELVVIRPNRSQTAIVASAMPLHDTHGVSEGILLLWQDVTTLKDAQHTRELLLSAASHELRTPLTSLLGFIQLLETRPDATLERREKWLSFVGEKARFMARLVEELINLSRAQTGWMKLVSEETDLRTLVQIAINEARAADTTRVFRFTPPSEPVMAMVDRQKMTQVVQNLLSNAVTYSPADTPIDILIENGEQKFRLTVRDYGIGILLEERQHIFQPFYRAEAAYKFAGAGLGLAVANSFVELHRGRLWVLSSGIPGEGATFIAELPNLDPPAR